MDIKNTVYNQWSNGKNYMGSRWKIDFDTYSIIGKRIYNSEADASRALKKVCESFGLKSNNIIFEDMFNTDFII